MLTTYTVRNGQLAAARRRAPRPPRCASAVWIDLLNPTPEEERAVQDALGFEMPTREEMQEIESSSRLYREERDALPHRELPLRRRQGEFGSTPITFVLATGALVTLRYATPKAFTVFGARCQRTPARCSRSPDAVMLHLFEQIVDRLADILERIGGDMDRAMHRPPSAPRASTEKVTKKDQRPAGALITLGQVGEVTTRTSETLLGLTRILTFVCAEKASAVRKENQPC